MSTQTQAEDIEDKDRDELVDFSIRLGQFCWGVYCRSKIGKLAASPRIELPLVLITRKMVAPLPILLIRMSGTTYFCSKIPA